MDKRTRYRGVGRAAQGRGEIESFEPVLLEPHGGDLAGLLLVRGERQMGKHLSA